MSGANTSELTVAIRATGSISLDDTVQLQLQGSYDNSAWGLGISVGTAVFQIDFSKSQKMVVASYESRGAALNLDALFSALGAKTEALGSVTLQSAMLAIAPPPDGGTSKNVAVSVDLGANIDLVNLPLVGKLLGPGKVSLEEVQFSYAKNTFSWEEKTIPAGVQLGATLVLAGTEKTISFAPGAPSAAPQQQAGLLATSDDTKTPGFYWLNVQKGLGPFFVSRVGAHYVSGHLDVLFDATLTAAGLSLSLEGLSVGSSLHSFSPSFDLDGLGLDFQRGPVQIGGAFLKTDITVNNEPAVEYDGMVVVQTALLSLSAIGSYANIDGHPSLFLYAFLGYPIGGPPFFFVEGLAFGFGLHRSLTMPAIGDVATFPLVALATGPVGGQATNKDGLEAMIASLHDYIPVDEEEDFLAVGVRYTTFELLDSFALVNVLFGSHFEVIVLGLSTMAVPTPEAGQSTSALAVLQTELEAWLDPSVGLFAIQSQLTSRSYVFSPDCHLTGGFALYSWFSGDHSGDFVVTLGGYHPDFTVPSYYPQVPRLGFNWILNSHLSIKGDAYFALTPQALMAGGQLSAVFETGPIKAWFIIGADFLIYWKPFHYQAHIYLDMGVSFTFHLFGTHHITISLSVDLQVWGPDFSGKARVHLWIISFTISFGSAVERPPPIPWSTFKTSFLPSQEKICTIQAIGGLIKSEMGTDATGKSVEYWVLNPLEMAIQLGSLVPTTQSPVGVRPVAPKNFCSCFEVTIQALDGAPPDLKQTPTSQNVPSAMWGPDEAYTGDEPDPNGTPTVSAVTGVLLTPNKEPQGDATCSVDRQVLLYDPQPFSEALPWQPVLPFTAAPVDLGASLTARSEQRAALLAAMGISAADIAAISVDATMAGAFLSTPETGRYQEAA